MRDLVYAKGSREFLAKPLFRMQHAETDPVGAARKLLARGRSYGLNRRITRADRARSAPSRARLHCTSMAGATSAPGRSSGHLFAS